MVVNRRKGGRAATAGTQPPFWVSGCGGADAGCRGWCLTRRRRCAEAFAIADGGPRRYMDCGWGHLPLHRRALLLRVGDLSGFQIQRSAETAEAKVKLFSSPLMAQKGGRVSGFRVASDSRLFPAFLFSSLNALLASHVRNLPIAGGPLAAPADRRSPRGRADGRREP